MLTNEQIIHKVRTAFLPLQCKAEIWDYDSKFRFRVLYGDKPVIRVDEIRLHAVQEEGCLDDILRQVRERIKNRGYALR